MADFLQDNQSEDCLYLNIFAPASGGLLPDIRRVIESAAVKEVQEEMRWISMLVDANRSCRGKRFPEKAGRRN